MARIDPDQGKDNIVLNQSFPIQEDFNEKVRPRIAEISSPVGHEGQVCCPRDEPLPHLELVL